jgi:hypothetical protein
MSAVIGSKMSGLQPLRFVSGHRFIRAVRESLILLKLSLSI